MKKTKEDDKIVVKSETRLSTDGAIYEAGLLISFYKQNGFLVDKLFFCSNFLPIPFTGYYFKISFVKGPRQ